MSNTFVQKIVPSYSNYVPKMFFMLLGNKPDWEISNVAMDCDNHCTMIAAAVKRSEHN